MKKRLRSKLIMQSIITAIVGLVLFMLLFTIGSFVTKIIIGSLLTFTVVSWILSYFLYYRKKEKEFKKRTTAHGVFLAKYPDKVKEIISFTEIQIIVSYVVFFWSQILKIPVSKVSEYIKDTEIQFVPIWPLTWGKGNQANAYTLLDKKLIVISTETNPEWKLTKNDWISSLLKHELSHIITANYDSKYQNGDEAHKLFSEVNLGA